MLNIVGQVLGLIGKYVYGWCYQADSLTERVLLEVYCDGYALGVVKADTFERSLQQQGIGDAHYGFVFALPEHVLLKGKRLAVKVANTSTWLEPNLDLMHELETDKAPSFSQVYTNAGLRLQGWVFYPDQPDKQLEVSVYCEHEKLLTVCADKYIAHLPQEARANGFDFTLPLHLADGKPHEIRLLDEKGRQLNGSPVTVVAYADGMQQLIEDASTSTSAQQLLKNVVKQYQVYVPRSLGMEHYPAWYEHFGRLPAAEADPAIQFIFLHGGTGNTTKALQSLQQQDGQWQWLALDEFTRSSQYQHLDKQAYCAFIGDGDHFPAHSLAHLSRCLAALQLPGMLYTDCDQDTPDGQRGNPWFKSAWNYEYFTAFNYLQGLCLVRGDLLAGIQQGLAPYSLSYQAVAQCLAQDEPIQHLAKLCYHRGANPSKASQPQHTAALQTLLNQQEVGAVAQALADHPECFRIMRPLPSKPLVSIIIPTRDRADLLEACLSSVLDKTHYQAIEILVVDNQSVEAATQQCFQHYQGRGVRIIDYPKPFNYSAINNHAVAQAQGEVICLLNNDVELISADWLEEMLGLLLRPGIGAVGAKLLWPNEMVQHGGVVLGEGGLAGHYGNHLHDQDAGYMYRNQVTQQLSAVTAACLLLRKSDYLAVNGLNTFDFPVAFNDVDLCLKLQAKGLRNIWSAHAKFWHFESASRGKEDNPAKAARAYREAQALKRYWGNVLVNDPHKPRVLDAQLDGLLLE